MEEFNEPILNKLFIVRSDEYESIFVDEHNAQLEKNRTNEKQKNLYNALEKAVGKENEIFTEINHLFNEFDGSYLEEINYWMEKYYKLGFCDAMKLKNEIKKTEDLPNGWENWKKLSRWIFRWF